MIHSGWAARMNSGDRRGNSPIVAGTMLRALGLGRAVLVSEVGSFAEFPDDVCLKVPVDDFFEKVLVNAKEPKVRANRLALLSELSYLLNKVADLAKLAA